ncbi:MAG: YfhO family protein, partial [Ruminococcus sp.]
MTHTLKRTTLKNRHYALLAFGLALLAASILFIPFIIANNGVFYYYGDFNVQEIPFYQLCHDAVRNGEIGWSHTTDLGTDFLSSYSFYLLGSPFFWLTIPFPNEFVPYLIGPLLILKFACASLAAYLYLKRYVSNKSYAVLGGLLYALSGFSIYNVFFFHFHEPMIMFPLLLAALDSFIYDKKRVVFAIAVFAACVVNYYFFVGQVLFVVMYYLMIMLTKTCRFKIKEFFILAIEVI